MQFSVEHYHAPQCFRHILQALYSDLVGKVITNEWETPPVPLDIGVYEGNPLSVVIFNTIINTLVQSRADLGYTLSSSTCQINLLQYVEQGRSKLFEGGVAKVYIPHVVYRGVWRHAPRKFVLGPMFCNS